MLMVLMPRLGSNPGGLLRGLAEGSLPLELLWRFIGKMLDVK